MARGERESGKARGDSASHLTVARAAAAKGMGWISRHDVVHGNERTDEEAWRAVSVGSSPESELPETLQGHSLLCSLVALCGKFKESLKLRWKAIWVKSPRKGRMDRIDDKLPSHSFLMATDHLS